MRACGGRGGVQDAVVGDATLDPDKEHQDPVRKNAPGGQDVNSDLHTVRGGG